MKNIPIVLIHKGDSAYLAASILHNKKFNPDTDIILIGDKRNSIYKGSVTHYLLVDYFKAAEAIAQKYIHLSTNGAEFELICIQRWFVLKEFMDRKGLDQCIFLDSDVLSFTALNVQKFKLEKYGMTMVGISAHTNFVLDKKILDTFCTFIEACYTTKADWLQKKYTEVIAGGKGGGVSDMTFFTEFRKLNPERIKDLQVPEEGVYDITFDYHQGFEMYKGFKKIVFRNGIPFGKLQDQAIFIPFYTIHFQGNSKKYLKKMAQVSGRQVILKEYYAVNFLVNRTLRKIKVKVSKFLSI